MIEMMHFPGRLNAGIFSVSFDDTDDNSGFSALKHFINDSISMTGKYCNDYAANSGADKNILRLINDTWGDYKDEKKVITPNYKLEYQKIEKSEILLDCITITFPKVCMKIERSNSKRMSIEQLADLLLKASIKSIIQDNSNEDFSINIFRINTDYKSFYKMNYSSIPDILKEDFEYLIYEVRNTDIYGNKFLYFYRDKWDFHFANFQLND